MPNPVVPIEEIKGKLSIRLKQKGTKTTEGQLRARRSAAVAYELGDLRGVFWITMIRLDADLAESEDEAEELYILHRLVAVEADRVLRREEREAEQREAYRVEKVEAKHQLIVERALKEEQARQRHHLERCAVKRSAPPVIKPKEVRVFRPSDAPIGESTPIPPLEVEETKLLDRNPIVGLTAEPQPRSRGAHNGAKPADGEMGARLRSDLDWALGMQNLNEDESTWPPMAEFDWEGLIGLAELIIEECQEESTPREPLGDPPQTESVALNAGPGGEEVEVVADEVVGALPEPAAAEPSVNLDLKGIAEELEETFFRAEGNDPDLLDNAWETMVAPDGHGHPEDVGELLRCLEEAPDVRSAALMSALERARKELVRTPTHTLIDTPVQIPIADLIAMTRALMSRLR
ncbi:hypothetical protein MITS9509_01364 [Synechococcus sp. MIT S9509]|uniref:hypothetical protein n=1 Tax=Synechococcus sp. MIT S9509 TaxID=1801630 RepID=UPI0007BADE4B|nr:hypothetical protein [Synechococcus sp. MIT S9509]KZR92377.1 hypothetical protein MITS9509_01364 [Synechococcus sp. MIT S9509]